MTYSEAIDWLYSTQNFGIKLGLEQARKLLRASLSFPKPGVKVIHVAGTNGKGSTCAIIHALAQACGTKSGLFTSPHLIDYRERILVGDQQISEEKAAQHLTKLKELVSDWEHHPTFFELTLALAMHYFREQECELIILETGMGGRLDATTSVPADLALITPIAMDHSEWLGDTLSEVATEKAGIIVRNKPVISSPQKPEAQGALEEQANELNSPLEFITEPLEGYTISLAGLHQKQNAALATHAAHKIGLPLNYDIVQSALSNVSWPGRFEHIPNSPFILDGAHNPHAAEALVSTWKNEHPNKKADLIFGALEGKNTDKVLAILAEITHHFHLTPIDAPRSLSIKDLSEALPPNTPYTIHQNLESALAIKSPLALITGSLFLVGQAKATISKTSTRPSAQ